VKHLKRFPFDPAKFPFFYGWPVLVFGTLGMLMSVPGQTVGVSVFTDFLIDALSLPRQFLSLAYLFGTLSSALVLTKAGRLYDRFGARTMGVGVSIALGLVLIYLSFSPSIAGGISSVMPGLDTVVAFIVITLGFFMLRFTGQGTLTLVSRNMVMEWFQKRRGIANGILGVAVSFGFSYSPRVLNDLVQSIGWQNAWRLLAVIVGVGFAFLAFIFYRDKPEHHGLVPDGGEVKESSRSHPETAVARDFTLKEARNTYTFWVFALGLLMSALIVTAFTFHVVSVFQTSGLSRETAVSIFFPSSIVAVTAQFAGSWMSDFIKLKYLLLVQITGMIVLCIGIILLGPGLPVLLIIIGNGLTQGMMGVNSNIVWPRFFGRLHLGSVSGFATSLIVAGSAVGPYIYSLSLDFAGSYTVAALISIAIVGTLFIAAFRADRPD